MTRLNHVPPQKSRSGRTVQGRRGHGENQPQGNDVRRPGGNEGAVATTVTARRAAKGDLGSPGAYAATVPLPAALWLLAPALASLSAFTRRRAA